MSPRCLLETFEARENFEHVIAVEEVVPGEIDIGETLHLWPLSDLLRQKPKLSTRSIQSVELVSKHLV